jgi:hypothetical protein
MSYKSQLFQSGNYETLRTPILPSWGHSPANLRDIQLISPWIEYDSKVRPGLARGVKWNTVLGLGLATVVSVGIWTGIVLAVARIWR